LQFLKLLRVRANIEQRNAQFAITSSTTNFPKQLLHFVNGSEPGADLIGREVIGTNRRDIRDAEFDCRDRSCVTGNNPVLSVDEYALHKSEFLDAPLDLLNLLFAMRAQIRGP
jgi:hypothetical protein